MTNRDADKPSTVDEIGAAHEDALKIRGVVMRTGCTIGAARRLGVSEAEIWNSLPCDRRVKRFKS